jgi:hypothetical protein
MVLWLDTAQGRCEERTEPYFDTVKEYQSI